MPTKIAWGGPHLYNQPAGRSGSATNANDVQNYYYYYVGGGQCPSTEDITTDTLVFTKGAGGQANWGAGNAVLTSDLTCAGVVVDSSSNWGYTLDLAGKTLTLRGSYTDGAGDFNGSTVDFDGAAGEINMTGSAGTCSHTWEQTDFVNSSGSNVGDFEIADATLTVKSTYGSPPKMQAKVRLYTLGATVLWNTDQGCDFGSKGYFQLDAGTIKLTTSVTIVHPLDLVFAVSGAQTCNFAGGSLGVGGPFPSVDLSQFSQVNVSGGTDQIDASAVLKTIIVNQTGGTVKMIGNTSASPTTIAASTNYVMSGGTLKLVAGNASWSSNNGQITGDLYQSAGTLIVGDGTNGSVANPPQLKITGDYGLSGGTLAIGVWVPTVLPGDPPYCGVSKLTVAGSISLSNSPTLEIDTYNANPSTGWGPYTFLSAGFGITGTWGTPVFGGDHSFTWTFNLLKTTISS